jgi:hypothetical protein
MHFCKVSRLMIFGDFGRGSKEVSFAIDQEETMPVFE